MNELKGIADEYGITLSKEGDLTQQLIEKKEALIGVIREEAIERQRANDITDASDTYQKNIQELKDQIKESLSDDFSDMQKNQLVNLISEEDIKKIAEAYKAMINAQKKSVELTGSWNSRFSTEQIGTYNKTISDLAEKVGVYSKALGVSEKSANDAKRAIQNNGMALATTRKEYDDTVNATNKAAAAAQSAEMATDGLTESQRSLSDKTRMAKENVNDLANEIKKMIETYNNSNINIQISYEELNTPPAWMQGVAQKMSSDQLKNLASLHQSRANRMRSHKAQTGRSLVMKNQQGYYTNEREEQVMAGQYAILAQQKKTEEENARRAAEEAKKKKTKSTTKKDDKKQLEQQQKDYAALIQKQEQERKREAEDLAFSTTEAEIAAMKDGTEKAIAQIDLDFKKKETEINLAYEDLKQQKIDKARELWKANPKNKDKVFDEKNVDTSYTKAETENYNAQLKANQAERDRNLAEEFAKEHQALNDYLKEYGDYQQKKLAIQQEYADKIAKAENAYQKASLANQRDNELKKLDASDVFEQIDWENVFADLSSHTKEYLVSLRAQLQSLLKSGKLTDVSDISKVQEKINDINAEISKQGGIFDFVGTKQQEHIRRINEAKEAQEALNSAKLQEADIEKQYEKALKQANHKAADLGVRAIGDDTTGIQANIDKAGIDKSTKEYKEMSSILTNLAVLEGKLAKAREKTAKATIEAKNKEDASKKSTTAQIADWFSDAQEFISKSGIDQLPELFSSLGMDEASAKIGQGLSALNDSAGAVADFESGNYIGALTKGISALQGFSNVLGIGADNTAKMQDKIDELNQKNDVLASCLEELNDTLQGTNSITGAQEVYKDAVELINAQKKNASDAMKAEANKHGTWRSSLNSSVNDNKTWKKDMEKVSKILGKTVKSSKDFLSLSPEEMKKIRDTDKDLFMSILNEYRKEGGKGGRSDKLPSMIQDYIDKYADAINDLNEQMSEKYTQMSFDDMKSSFFDALMDMDKDAEDFSDDFSKYLMKSVLNAKIGDLLDKDLKEFYDEWSKLAEDGLSETEIDYLNNKWDTIVNKGLKFRDEASKVTGYTGSSSQTATSVGWQSMGQETADELNGRFTALQIAGEQAKVNTDLIVSAVNTLVAKTDANFSAVSEVRNMMIMTNSYLEDIRKYNKLTYEEFGSKLDDIKMSLKNL